MPPIAPLDVFISSTCYDLADLRFELKDHLERQGFNVRLSEDPASGFYVDPEGTSIESCLANVEASDVVVCILDRRYGPPLKREPWGEQSATEAEVRFARELKPRKPVFFFVRDVALRDFHDLKANPDAKTRWVEQGKPEQAALWVRFAQYAIDLPEHRGRSNWCDPFRTVVELKPLVVKRLNDKFPRHAASKALQPDRFVRLMFERRGGAIGGYTYGEFVNAGVGPAFNLRYGLALGELLPAQEERHFGGLAEGRSITDSNKGPLRLKRLNSGNAIVVCEYENRFGDRYRIEHTDLEPTTGRYLDHERERLYVGLPGDDGAVRWVEVS